MAALGLSTRDINVLEKIKDPESDPLQRINIDATIPRDPHVKDPVVYQSLVDKERQVIRSLQEAEVALSGLGTSSSRCDPTERYKQAVSDLSDLIAENPNYASARNNKAQVMRRLYGDTMLVDGQTDPQALIKAPSKEERHHCAAETLRDLNTCINLLTPDTPRTPISPQAARTLAAAHTQRAAIYHRTARLIGLNNELDIGGEVEEIVGLAKWKKLEFEEAASKDFAWGGRYGNEIAKALAVGTNPTAKLCGEIVRGAMKKEYGEEFAG